MKEVNTRTFPASLNYYSRIMRSTARNKEQYHFQQELIHADNKHCLSLSQQERTQLAHKLGTVIKDLDTANQCFVLQRSFEATS